MKKNNHIVIILYCVKISFGVPIGHLSRFQINSFLFFITEFEILIEFNITSSKLNTLKVKRITSLKIYDICEMLI